MEWYDAERPGLGDEFADEVIKALDPMVAHPEAWPAVSPRGRGQTIRRFIVPRVPYALVYVARDNQLLVLAVAHAKRKPGYWRRRTR